MIMGFMVLDENNTVRLFTSELDFACWFAKDLTMKGHTAHVEFFSDAFLKDKEKP